MEIKNIDIKTLRENCVDLVARTYLELDQQRKKDDIVSFALILADDLKLDFGNGLTFDDIRQAFRQGIRNTDKFHLNVKTYYHWIKAHRQIIWDNETVEPERRDKRLNYRKENFKILTSNVHFKKIGNGGK
tara:strand:+ start:420 stop:812 length:393 start_codon:yes stop_codon:yes gene_type:complete